MGKQFGNQGVNAPSDNQDHPQSSPSTINPPPTTSSYPKGQATHVHHSPLGEGLSQSERQFRQPSYSKEKEQGPKLDRAVERQYANGPHADGARRFGMIGSGEGGSRNPYAGTGLRNESRESFTTDEDESYRRRYGLK